MQALVTPLPAATALPRPPGAPGGGRDQAAVDSTTLLQGQKAVTILHNGALYRLQATRLGKLILTK